MQTAKVAALIGIIVGGCASMAPLEGRWILAESPHPETVSISIHGDVIEFSHQCMRSGGKFQLDHEQLILAQEIVIEGRCHKKWDIAAEGQFRDLTEAGATGLSLVREGTKLLLSDRAGKALRFRRAPAPVQ